MSTVDDKKMVIWRQQCHLPTQCFNGSACWWNTQIYFTTHLSCKPGQLAETEQTACRSEANSQKMAHVDTQHISPHPTSFITRQITQLLVVAFDQQLSTLSTIQLRSSACRLRLISVTTYVGGI